MGLLPGEDVDGDADKEEEGDADPSKEDTSGDDGADDVGDGEGADDPIGGFGDGGAGLLGVVVGVLPRYFLYAPLVKVLHCPQLLPPPLMRNAA
jgi:hypothetical protein